MASDDDFDMSRYSSSGYSSAEVRLHPLLPPQTTGAKLPLPGSKAGVGFLRGRRQARGAEPCGGGAPREVRPGL